MIVTVHQPEHLPWLGFFDKMRLSDVCVLLDTTQFAKDDFQNRNRIKTAVGVKWLTVPVYKKGRSEQLIKEVEICNDRNWRHKSWLQIEAAYKDAPYFRDYEADIKEIYNQKWLNLVDINIHIIRLFADILGLSTHLLTASEMGIYERGGNSVNLAICRELGADIYLSGKFGREYLDEDLFADYDISVCYQDFHHPVYSQLWGDFEPNMSAIDLLFNCGKSSLEIIAQANIATILEASLALS